MPEERKGKKYHRTRPSIKPPRAPQCETMTPKESMAVTGFGENVTYRLLKAGMPAIRVGKRYFIPRTALLEWLKNAANKGLAA
jgi:excisionase family DNA binding protein